MANQKISELTAISTIDNATDVLPIVDTSATTTKKITLTQVKTSLALNNVDNTSDANKPVSTATQTALDSKVTGNAAITGATKTKVTYDAKGLVTAGADATTADIADSTNKRYVTDAQLTVIGNTSGTNTGDNAVNSLYSGLATSKQDALVSGTNIKTVNSTSLLGSGNVAVQETLVSGTNIKTVNSTTILGSGDIAVQPTLVSGTNIKTINSTSLLGSGDIVISASPSGVAGAIQFSNGSAFASDAANLFFDDTNNRLGVGTNAPSATGHFKGSGSTSATTSLLVQNSAGTEGLRIYDNQDFVSPNLSAILSGSTYLVRMGSTNSRLEFLNSSSSAEIAGYYRTGGTFVNLDIYSANLNLQPYGNTVNVGTQTSVASAVFNIQSTTKGFLPPRMTTTQKNAISSPAAGLVIYDTTLAKLCVYTTTWETITSL